MHERYSIKIVNKIAKFQANSIKCHHSQSETYPSIDVTLVIRLFWRRDLKKLQMDITPLKLGSAISHQTSCFNIQHL